MSRLTPPKPITAIIYAEGASVDPVMQAIAGYLRRRGMRLAGFLQQSQERPGQARCDMILDELASGEQISISENRGRHARGCMLNMDELLRAGHLATQALKAGPDLLLINKFGKTECEGGGFRPLIAEALDMNVPVLLAVPARNLECWRAYSEGLAADHPIETLPGDSTTLCHRLGLVPGDVATRPGSGSAHAELELRPGIPPGQP